MNASTFLAALALPALLFALPAEAAGKFPTTVKAGADTLVLNGKGMREATVFKVDVYEGALYLKKKSSNATVILKTDAPWSLKMNFVRDVKKGKLTSAWSDGFKNNAGGKGQTGLKKLNSWMGNIKDGQSMSFTYVPGVGTEVRFAGKVKGTIKGADFGRALLSVWLGKTPPSKRLKKGLLGK
ncbi:MAG: hypothetical protein GY822_16740 [Deltaproteobacteria bacterium]|nr:hypothetical protein [Deltaproteobacteria bacterium]